MGWLSDWQNRRKITISNINVDAVLSDFPILVKISASSGTGSTDITDIFTELAGDANRKKIAVTVSDGTTQCYVEIERWDHTNSAAWLWVKVPSVASGSATDLYIYYDSAQADNTTYIGDTGDTPAQSVWDSNFQLVAHMAQDPNGDIADAIKDSTVNANHGTPGGSMTSADLVDGKVGKAIDFDGNDFLTVTADASLKFGTGDFTIESLFKTTSADAIAMLSYGDRANNPGWTSYVGADGHAKFIIDDATNQVVIEDAANHADGSLHYYSAVLDRNGNCVINIDNAPVASEDISGVNLTLDTTDHDEINIARAWYGTSYTVYYTGLIDEVRISDTARSVAWVKATYYSNWDGLVLYSSQEALAEIFFPSPMAVTASIQSNIQVELSSNLLTVTTSMPVIDIYYGGLVNCPSSLGAASSLQADIELLIPSVRFTSVGTLQSQSELQIFTGDVLAATGSILATVEEPFSVAILPRIYTFTLTGAADGIADIVIPISSFQSRIKSGTPTYLSVVIPGTDYSSEINLRLNGKLVIRMGYLSNDEFILSEIIASVDFESIIINEGGVNKSITLDGHKTETWIPKEVDLVGASYMNLDNGELRYRCTPNIYVRPGDTVSINGDSFIVENITYSVSAELETFEVSE